MQKILHNVNIWVWLAAVVVLAAGLLWTAHNAVMAPKWAEAMRKQTVVWEQLRAVEAAQQAAHSRLAVLRELPHPVRPAPLTRLAIECTPDARPEVLDRGVRALPDGWQARQMEMQYGEVDLEAVGALLCRRRTTSALDALRVQNRSLYTTGGTRAGYFAPGVVGTGLRVVACQR